MITAACLTAAGESGEEDNWMLFLWSLEMTLFRPGPSRDGRSSSDNKSSSSLIFVFTQGEVRFRKELNPKFQNQELPCL